MSTASCLLIIHCACTFEIAPVTNLLQIVVREVTITKQPEKLRETSKQSLEILALS